MPAFEAHYISHSSTRAFSPLVEDYLRQSPALKSFYEFPIGDDGLAAALQQRAQYPVDRTLLKRTLLAQYRANNLEDSQNWQAVHHNINLLDQPETFTICTAHQPNLLTGYLYFIYKILHTVALAQHAQQLFPKHHFVPVFYMGSEDNDLDELSVFNYDGKKYRWNGDGQAGAVGRMHTKGISSILQELYEVMGPPGDHLSELKTILNHAYSLPNIAAATQYLIHSLLGQHGVVVLNPDDKGLKQTFIPIMEEELLQHTARPLVLATNNELQQHYKTQAYVRPINLFYLTDTLRARIEQDHDGNYLVKDTALKFSSEGIITELHEHPERFSPNVILRGLYQETLLPNIAFIGGGSEVAYWLQLSKLFKHHNVFYPQLILRQSALMVPPAAQVLQRKLAISDTDLFLPTNTLQQHLLRASKGAALSLTDEQASLSTILEAIKGKATSIDATLGPSTEAALAKISKQLQQLSKKMMRAAKRQDHVRMQQVATLKDQLFPNHHLQEREENFIQYYPYYGPTWFQELLQYLLPYGDAFLILHLNGE